MIYLDNNATTRIDERVLAKMLPYLDEFYFNPSSVYREAQKIKSKIEKQRANVAQLLGCRPDEIIFTSGGTESDNTALKGIAYALQDKGNHIITSKIEHLAVLNTCKFLETQGYKVTYLDVDKCGIVDTQQLKDSINKKTILISIMHANNETGTIQPMDKISTIAKLKGIYFHTDAVQTAGKVPVKVEELGVDLLSLSAHKFYGPKGIGALYIKRGTKILPLVQGGHHEKNRRAGTENTAGIIGLGEACLLAKEEMGQRETLIRPLRDKLEQKILEKIPEVEIFGHLQKRLYNTLNLGFKFIDGESVVINLDLEGICVSSGSACTSGSFEASHVLSAMGIPDEVGRSSIRFSFSKFNTQAQVDKVLEVLPRVVEKLRKLSPLWKKNP